MLGSAPEAAEHGLGSTACSAPSGTWVPPSARWHQRHGVLRLAGQERGRAAMHPVFVAGAPVRRQGMPALAARSEEHTSELQSQSNLVCRLLLEKKKNTEDAAI